VDKSAISTAAREKLSLSLSFALAPFFGNSMLQRTMELDIPTH
jgi:hypothetical protein